MEFKMNAPVKVAIVGTGRAGGGMIAAEIERSPEKFKLEAVCDILESQSAPYKEKFNCKSYSAAKDLYADKDVELVVIATPSTFHCSMALDALAAGKHVFLEKPISLTYEDALKMADAAKKSKGKLLFRQNRRFESAFQHIREIIASGILGEVFEVKLRRNAYQRRRDWQTLIDCGGGQLNNWGPHIIDHALCFLDCPVKEIWSNLKLIAAAGDAEDHLKIILQGQNRRIVDLEISGGAAITEPEYTIFGTKGGLQSSGQEIKLRYLDPDVKLEKLQPSRGLGIGANTEQLPWIEKTLAVDPATKCNMMDSIWHHLYETLRNDKVFPITTEQALEVIRVIAEVKKRSPVESYS